MVVIKNDERTGRFRDRSGNIKAYSKANHIPKVLVFHVMPLQCRCELACACIVLHNW